MTRTETRNSASPGSPEQEIRIAFWNLQNLFDAESSPIATELDFTPAFGWDREALDVRIRNLADVIRQMFDGRGPDLLGICEIESERLANRLIREIGRSDYRLALLKQPGFQALDTALIYSDRVLACDDDATRGYLLHQRYATRDILEVHFTVRANDARLTVLVNHWPSVKPSRHETEPLRIAVAGECARIVNGLVKLPRREYIELGDSDVSLFRLNQQWDRNVLLMGDLNDDPWSRSVREVLHASFSADAVDDPLKLQRGSLPSWRAYSGHRVPLFNPMFALLSRPDQGTVFCPDETPRIRLPDQFLLSRGLYFGLQGLKASEREPGIPDVRIFRPDVMMARHNRPKEYRRELQSGYSNHFPILMAVHVTGDDVAAGD